MTTSTMSGARRRWSPSCPYFSAVVTAIAATWCYAGNFDAPFIFDDVPSITENAGIRALWPDQRLWSMRQSPLSGRPVVAFSFAVNYAVGGLDPRGYRIVNLGLHIATAWLLAALVRRTVAESPVMKPFVARANAWAATIALLWAVHPLHSETVTYVTQRTELAASLCYVAVLYAAVRAWRSSGWLWPTITIAAAWTGIACKEIVATAPLMVAAYDQVFFADRWNAERRRRLPLYAGLASCWLLFVAIQWTGPRAKSVGFEIGVTWWKYLFVQAGVLLHYLRLVFVPNRLCGDYGEFNSLAWCSPLILPGLFVVGGLLIATAWVWRRDRRWAFLGIWFFLILAPSSSVVPIATETASERRMYLPLVAVLAALVVAGDRLLARLTVLKFAVATFAFAACLVVTVDRLRIYQTELAFWQDVALKMPDSPRALANLGGTFLKLKQYDKSGPLLYRAIELDPYFAAGHNSLGLYLLAVGRNDEAAHEFTIARDLSPNTVPYRANLGAALDRAGRTDDAVAELSQAIALGDDYVAVRINLANVLARRGRFAEALTHLERAIELDPRNETCRENLNQLHADLAHAPPAQAAAVATQ